MDVWAGWIDSGAYSDRDWNMLGVYASLAAGQRAARRLIEGEIAKEERRAAGWRQARSAADLDGYNPNSYLARLTPAAFALKRSEMIADAEQEAAWWRTLLTQDWDGEAGQDGALQSVALAFPSDSERFLQGWRFVLARFPLET